ncbi:LytTr DNA-binding domain protein [Sphingobacterium spiritivorum ATCC 33300]|uniref:LytTr DNA-binding domain protein n=3 Tax=Sphingobacterium spiritivorum TaxID=258 RepID=D7VTN7_SPHSI|nr:LytTR family DNA-binding domain-containing protein [Sphingobacterium spiritivorum]EEI90998.1 LytTr DNA-binding domain protein [Sphingobacterium spiritivorum ATCC 33300]EFK55796.1 LytTr DNA-binding domain protein [Sphingobacterium spiritivorum ATCC 33861]QQS97873.1 response regulator transcription factor [Sphingobacterium spiritivorum]QQT37296.1 response regulator transcription factor [Sphingobacterium spiritivorum]WQD34081.1 LytTR family DNA-binding domain-containing protein [Sphingobacteri
MNIIIIEDEMPSARLLKRKVENMGYTVTALLHSVEDAKAWLLSNPEPELIFLDIQLSDGLSFEIFEEVNVQSAIIFTTAYDEFVLRAFKMNSIDYLLKPIIEEELKFAFDKFLKLQHSKEAVDMNEIRSLLKLTKKESYKERFTIKIGQTIKVIDIQDIACIYSEHKGTYLWTRQGNNYLLDITLDKVEKMIDPNRFFRISRSHIIQIDSIKEIAVHSNSRLRIYLQPDPDQEMIVSRERVSDFKSWLEK